MPIVTALRN
jgi:hypothetical protein